MARESAHHSGKQGESRPDTARARRRRFWLTAASAFCAALPLSLGCAATQGVSNYFQYSETCDDFITSWRNSVTARNAWLAHSGQCDCGVESYSYGEGFRDGYISILNGGNGCPPALPPRKFWSWRYQGEAGAEKVKAWYSGFSAGVEAAQQDGAGQVNRIVTSEQFRAQYTDAFRSGYCSECAGEEGLDYQLWPLDDNGVPTPIEGGEGVDPIYPSAKTKTGKGTRSAKADTRNRSARAPNANRGR